MDLNKVFSFIKLTQKFRAVVRDVSVGEERFENDMEHSYQLAMMVWYLASANSLDYDIDRLIRYALIHDLVETYAGDTPALTSSAGEISSKFTREEAAFKRIREECPEFEDLEIVWNSYRQKADKESRLVYVIDKVMPVLNEIQQNSGFYKKNKISWEKWKAWLKSKLDAADYSRLEDGGFIEKLIEYLESDKERLFFS